MCDNHYQQEFDVMENLLEIDELDLTIKKEIRNNVNLNFV